MKLNYKASNIAKAEQKFNIKLFAVLNDFATKNEKDSVSSNVGIIDILFLWCAGGGTEEQFDVAIESDIEQVMLDIMAGLNEAGFLGIKGKLDLEQAKKDLRGLVQTGEKN